MAAKAVHRRDSVDRVLDEWAAERPDLDVRPVGVVTRLARVRAHLDAELAALFDRYDLSPADFQVIVILRRSGAPYRLPQARLMAGLGLTSGTVSVRIERLVRRGVVARETDGANARVSLIRLTEEGLRLFDELAPVHLANEDRLLSALDEQDRATLADLLRRLLVSFEQPAADLTSSWGLTVESAHRARARRTAVGLSDTVGLLVTGLAPSGPAAAAGLARGDLIVAVNGIPVRCPDTLDEAATKSRREADVDVLRGDERLALRLRRPPAPRRA